MHFKLIKLTLRTKQGNVNFSFSETLTYIYGKMGAGKTTVCRLIAYCFGEDLIDTPALQQEFVGASVDAIIGNNIVTLSRTKEDKNKVLIEWFNEEQQNLKQQAIVPIIGEPNCSVLPDAEIENLSDMLFYLMGINAPKVRKNKTSEDSNLVRLSFKNIMWFWYLDQDNIDSSFFHLDERSFQRNASLDVMRMLLGFRYEMVADLEMQLNEARIEKRGLEESVFQLTTFLSDNGIEGIDEIDIKIRELDNRKENLSKQRTKLLSDHDYSSTHGTDNLRREIRKYITSISSMEMALSEIENQILIKEQLSAEFLSASIKSDNLRMVNIILDGARFTECPQCGQSIRKEANDNTCYLCGQHIDKTSENAYEIIYKDLVARRKEIDKSIALLEDQKRNISLELNVFVSKKEELDEKLTKDMAEYDSLYVSNIREFDIKIDSINSEIKYWEKVKELPRQINVLKGKLDSIILKTESLKMALNEAITKAAQQENRLEHLKSIFLDVLNRVNFPGIHTDDIVELSTKDFYPRIYSKSNDIYQVDFVSLSSGGKKTIFKACFALALQMLLADEKLLPFPNLLIIDTPMKNISERENRDIFQSFYELIYSLMQNELKDLQLIIVDKEYFPPPEECCIQMIEKYMTPDDPENPGLIPYYHGY